MCVLFLLLFLFVAVAVAVFPLLTHGSLATSSNGSRPLHLYTSKCPALGKAAAADEVHQRWSRDAVGVWCSQDASKDLKNMDVKAMKI